MIKRGLTALAVFATAGAAQAAPVDLSGWTAEGSAGQYNWVLQPGNDAVRQTLNGNPTVFYGPGDAQGKALKGSIRVNDVGDDDFIGFVLGYNSGDLGAGATDFILVDWKGGTQNYWGVAEKGLAISRATQGLGDNAGAWAKNGYGVTELARGLNLGSTGWVRSRDYTFSLEFTASNIKVFVDGVKEIDLDGTFANGAFGFYNYSQPNVLYAGITEDVLPPTPGVPEPASWAMLILGFGLVGSVVRRRRLEQTRSTT